MKFLKVIAKNFMQYKDLDLDLYNKGLCLVNGETKGVSFGDSNTAGKTTAIVHTILWNLFGETASKLKGNDVINDTVDKECYVKLLVEHNKIIYSIIRYRKHSKYKNDLRLCVNDVNCDDIAETDDISKSSNAETQKELNNLFNLNWHIFTNTVIFGQGNVKRFSEYTDSERKDLLDKILNLDILKVLQKNAADKIKVIKAELATSYALNETYNNSIESIKDNISNFTNSTKEFENNKIKNIDNINEELKKLNDKLNELKSKDFKNLDTLLNKVNVALTTFDVYSSKLEKTKDKIQQINSNISVKEFEVNSIKKEIDKIKNRIDNVENSSREDCDNCGQPITEKSKEDFIENLHIGTKGLSDKKEEVLDELSILDSKQTKFSTRKSNLVDKLEKEEEFEEYKRKILLKIEKSKLNDELISQVKDNIKTKEDEIIKLKGEENPFTVILEKYKKEKKDITSKIILLSTKQEESQGEFNLLKFWEQGFSNKGIKSLLLDTIVPYMTEKTNYYLQFLTNGEIKISFSSQSSLKSDDAIREKIDIKLIKNGKPYTFEKTSGGERRRIDICISLALQSLITSNNELTNITIYDEIFDSLDETGIDYTVNLLKEELKTKDSIFVISHDSNLKDKFTNILTIKKKNGVSYV